MEDMEKSLLIVIALIIIAAAFVANIVTPEGTPVIAESRNVFIAILTGAFVGLLGYMQKTDLPNWETAKFLVTLIVSAVAGYVAYQYSLSYDNALAYVTSIAGIDVLVERLLKTFIRRLAPSNST